MNDGDPCLLKNSSTEIMSGRHVQNCQHFVLHTSSFQTYWLLQVAFQMPANETMHYYSRTISAGISYMHDRHISLQNDPAIAVKPS